MATISTATNEKVISVKKFLGLNENGDNNLKVGEASVCENFKVTNNGDLEKRAGTILLYTLGAAPVKGMWHGFVNKREIFVAACAGHLWMVMDEGAWKNSPADLGAYSTQNDVCFFGFEEKLYALNGDTYAVLYYATNAWHLDDVSSGSYGYRPLVKIAVQPDGEGELLEQVNKLNGLRRCWISPDEESLSFQLPETNLQSIDYVKNLATNAYLVAGTDYTTDTVNGIVTFTTAPGLGVNSYEIGWIYGTNFASTVKKMLYAEKYAGTQDNRVFLYGDGSNHAFYSGLDYDGKPRADYFPDLNEVDVGDANTPITSLIRHYAKMIAQKPNETYSIDYGVVTLADSTLTPAFYSTPINKNIGNQAPGQVRLVQAAPRSLCEGGLYEWRSGTSYAANISMDERQAKRISDRIQKTLQAMDFSKVHCYDDDFNYEYYIVDKDGNALVHNYAADAWYYYTGIDAYIVYSVGKTVYIGTKSGKILKLDSETYGDVGDSTLTCAEATVNKATWETKITESGTYVFEYDGDLWTFGLLWVDLEDYGIEYEGVPEAGDTITVVYWKTKRIDCQWDSGSMDFGAMNMRKYSPLMWVSVKSQENNLVDVTVQTDRTTENTTIAVDPDFINDMPKVKRCKIKVKKFVYYRLKFRSNTDNTTTTIVDTGIKVRATSQAK